MKETENNNPVAAMPMPKFIPALLFLIVLAWKTPSAYAGINAGSFAAGGVGGKWNCSMLCLLASS